MNSGGYMPFSQTQYGPALGATNMFPSDDSPTTVSASLDPGSSVYLGMGFTGRVECAPHDNVHDNIGGWMANVPAAAGDPVFYVHHCQIDRLFASWAAQKGVVYNWGAGSDPDDPDQKSWKERTASFVDEKGQLVTVKLTDAMATEALDYTYDKLAEPPRQTLIAASAALASPSPAVHLTLATMSSGQFSVQSGGTTMTLVPEPGAVAPHAEMSVRAPEQREPQILTLQGLRLIRRPPAPLSIVLNMPKATPPRLNNPYYVATLNLFNFDLGTGGFMSHTGGEGHHDHTGGVTVRFDVTDLLQRQLAKGLWDGGPVAVTISTIGADAPSSVVYLEMSRVALGH